MIPLLKVKKIIEASLAYIEQDFNNTVNEQETFLYRVLGVSELDDYKFFEQAKEVFLRGKNSSRKLGVKIAFDRTFTNVPNLILRTPMDRESKYDTIGTGYEGNRFYENEDGSTTDKLHYTRQGNYELLITGANENECLMIYDVMFNVLFNLSDTLAQYFNLFKVTGKEVIYNPEVISGLFSRVIDIELVYTRNVPRIGLKNFVQNVTFESPDLLNF